MCHVSAGAASFGLSIRSRQADSIWRAGRDIDADWPLRRRIAAIRLEASRTVQGRDQAIAKRLPSFVAPQNPCFVDNAVFHRLSAVDEITVDEVDQSVA